MCSENFGGAKAFSEIETKNVAKKILSIKDKLKIYITLHSYSQLWLYPYVIQINNNLYQILISL